MTSAHLPHDAAVAHINERPLALGLDSRPTVRQTLTAILDLVGFDTIVVGDAVEALTSIDDLQPRPLIVEASLWPCIRPHLVANRAVASTDLRRTPTFGLGEGGYTPASDVHRAVSAGDVDELLLLLESLGAASPPHGSPR